MKKPLIPIINFLFGIEDSFGGISFTDDISLILLNKKAHSKLLIFLTLLWNDSYVLTEYEDFRLSHSQKLCIETSDNIYIEV